MSDPKEALERLKAENDAFRAALKWVPQVQPGHLNGGAYVSMTWGEFNAMREAIGLRPVPYRGPDAKAATNAVNMALRVKLETAEADRAVLIAEREGLEREVENLRDTLRYADSKTEAAEAKLSALEEALSKLITAASGKAGMSLQGGRERDALAKAVAALAVFQSRQENAIGEQT